MLFTYKIFVTSWYKNYLLIVSQLVVCSIADITCILQACWKVQGGTKVTINILSCNKSYYNHIFAYILHDVNTYIVSSGNLCPACRLAINQLIGFSNYWLMQTSQHYSKQQHLCQIKIHFSTMKFQLSGFKYTIYSYGQRMRVVVLHDRLSEKL